MIERKSWDEYFIEEAARVAGRSKDPAKKVGAIIVRPDRTEAGRGYNGFPPQVEDREDRLNNKTFKSAVMLHAEESALWSARREDLTGYTLYVSPYMPCAHCAAWIIRSGIKRVVTDMGSFSEKWRDSFEITKEVFAEAGVALDIIGEEPVPEVGQNVAYGGQPHFIMVDEHGEDAVLCHLIFEDTQDVTHFKVLAGDSSFGSYFTKNRFGMIRANGVVLVDRGNRHVQKDLGSYTICWRGTMQSDDYADVARVGEVYRQRFDLER